jgi:ABC-type branched-subunit amino acid transport system substrate-binding protein
MQELSRCDGFWPVRPTSNIPLRRFSFMYLRISRMCEIHTRIVLVATAALLASLLTVDARAENGVSADKIMLGQAAALTGPSAELGLGMKVGLEAAFAEANRAGGIKGRKLELRSVDDGYEPTRSIEVVKKLLVDDKVFSIIGTVGTPTAAAIQPIATDAGVPMIGAFTGAEFLREPYPPLVMNVRATYFQETEAMVEHLTKDLGYTRIGIMYQDDAYGQAGLAGLQRALEKRNMKLAGEGTYERNTVAVKSALLSVRKAKPEAVVMIASYKSAATFIKVARQIKFEPTFVNISFVGSDALAKELGPEGAGVVVTQVVPFPFDTGIPVVARYQASLKEVAPKEQPGFVSLEGYLVGRTLIAGLEKIDGEPTRKGLIEAVQKASPLDLGGLKLSFSATSNRGSDQVFLTVIQPDGRFKAVERLPKAGI